MRKLNEIINSRGILMWIYNPTGSVFLPHHSHVSLGAREIEAMHGGYIITMTDVSAPLFA